METYIRPERSRWAEICRRPSSGNSEIEAVVRTIIERVREDGDRALLQLCREIDGFSPDSLEVSREEFDRAEQEVDPKVKKAIAAAAANIRKFHLAQKPSVIELETSPGVRCIQKPVPIGKVGLYIPGGTAPLFSTVLMLAIPACLAGCGEIVLCTPAGKNGRVSPEVLYAASYCRLRKVFKTGGAQAVAAMALGTESIPKVDKIFGPGNQYVTTAKQLLSKDSVSIDMPAGPSEVMVMADATADASFVAADLLSQAEHGRDSQVMLVCDDESFAEKVSAEVLRQAEGTDRAELAGEALGKSRFVVFDEMRDMVDFAETYAPEHLIISTENPWAVCSRISAAGSVFIGRYSPESAGDYASGTNHTLPTCGWARSCSGVNMDSFMRKMTIQEISREGLEGLSDTIVDMALAEGLQAHADAVRIRLKN